jgi:restriction system protein
LAVPDFQTIMLPMLEFVSDGSERTMQEARQALSVKFQLTPSDLDERLPSGRQTTFANRVAWAKVYLTQAGLLDSPKRGSLSISQRGKDVLLKKPSKIDIKFLEQFPEYLKFRQAGKMHSLKVEVVAPGPEQSAATPEEALEKAYQQIRDEVSGQLLELIKNNSPEFFESLVVRLLVQMGYGGSEKEAGKATQRTADEGIDGIIKEDRLGLDTIYLQAKRWEGVVGRPEIQKFVGALHGQRAKKGVFITTSFFSSGAIEYVAQIDPKVVLIDGSELVQLMIDYGLGVNSVATFEVKKVDSDFFVEE